MYHHNPFCDSLNKDLYLYIHWLSQYQQNDIRIGVSLVHYFSLITQLAL